MQRITPHDSETCVMLESLLGHDAFITELTDNFTIHASYNEEHTPEYLSAVINAVIGRMGNRFVEVNDDANLRVLKFTIEYDAQILPDIYGTLDQRKPNDLAGKVYCKTLDQIRAIQVRRECAGQLTDFVGGGQINIEKCPGGKAWFTFQNNGVFVDVPEFDYIVKRYGGNSYEIWPKDSFELTWEPK